MPHPFLPITAELRANISSIELPQSLGFGQIKLPIMVHASYTKGQWEKAEVLPYGPISLDPSAKVLHYSQEIFEGMKAYRNKQDEIFLFRPRENFNRFNNSARRMAMPEVPESLFMGAIESLTYHVKELIPNGLGESLYLRPFMIASEGGLGLKVSNEYLFMVLGSPSGNYFASDKVKVLIERESCRAAPGGTGAVKAGGNYGASLLALNKLKERGFDQNLWLDARESRYIEEFSGMNFFAVVDGELWTPPLSDTILPGITRDSIIEIARSILKLKCFEKPIAIDELLNLIQTKSCSEVFACGTAAVVSPIAEIYDTNQEVYPIPNPNGELALKLRELLLNIQTGHLAPPNKDWIHPIKKAG